MIGDPSSCAYFLCLKSQSGLMRFISELLSELGKCPLPWPDLPGPRIPPCLSTNHAEFHLLCPAVESRFFRYELAFSC